MLSDRILNANDMIDVLRSQADALVRHGTLLDARFDVRSIRKTNDMGGFEMELKLRYNLRTPLSAITPTGF